MYSSRTRRASGSAASRGQAGNRYLRQMLVVGAPNANMCAKAARAHFDALAAESIEAVFQAVPTDATQDGDMTAAKLLD